MKVAGVAPDDPAMVRGPRADPGAGRAGRGQRLHQDPAGAVRRVRLGAASPRCRSRSCCCPAGPTSTCYEVSYWSRTVIVPLLILMDRKPVQRLPRVLPPRRAVAGAAPPCQPALPPRAAAVLAARPSSGRTSSSAWTTASRAGSASGRGPCGRAPSRRRGAGSRTRLAVPGGLGGIFPAMANAVLALRLLGYPDDHPLIRGQIKEIEALGVEEPRVASLPALRLAGLGHRAGRQRAHRARACPPTIRSSGARRSGCWTSRSRCPATGRSSARTCRPAAGRSSTTTTSIRTSTTRPWSLMALEKIERPDPERRQRCDRARPRRGSSACRARTAAGRRSTPTTTGSSSTTSRSPTTAPCSIPSTEDLTGRGLELLGTLGLSARIDPAARRALGFIRRTQTARRLVVRALGRELHLRHLVGAARARGHRRGPRATTTCGARCAWLERAAERGRRLGRDAATPTTIPRWPARGSRSRARRRGRCSRSSPRGTPRARRSSAASTT